MSLLFGKVLRSKATFVNWCLRNHNRSELDFHRCSCWQTRDV